MEKDKKELSEKIDKIKEHFESISIEQMEENLIKAGIEEIKPSKMEIITKEKHPCQPLFCGSLKDISEHK